MVRTAQATSKECGGDKGAGSNGCHCIPHRVGWTLIELAVALTLLVVLAAMAITTLSHTRVPDLQCAADVMAADLAYVRHLAVTRGTTYEVRFDLAAGSYQVVHAGTNSAYNQVAPPPGLSPSAQTPTGYVHRLSDIPTWSGIRLQSVRVTEPSPQSITSFSFGPTGEVSPMQPIRITLAAGGAAEIRTIALDIVPQTGLVLVGEPAAADRNRVNGFAKATVQ